uniref:Uncharacterized protein n=1 Tax=Arundo donax TaxID=35708 RepID=A0A0A9B531_ARUDO
MTLTAVYMANAILVQLYYCRGQYLPLP